jgi:O-antigen ligase
MNDIIILKIFVIVFSSLFLVFLAFKKPELSGFFEKAGLFGIFLFALFIPLKDGFAIFGMVVTIIFFIAYRISKRDFKLPYTVFNKPIIIYLLITALSFIWTYSIKDSIGIGGEIFYFFAFFFAAAALLNTKKRINLIIYVFTFSISIAIIYSLFPGFFINVLFIHNNTLLNNDSLWNRNGGFFINAIYTDNRLAGPINNWGSYPVQISYGIIVIMAYYMIDFSKQNKGLKSSLKNLPAFLFILLILIGFFDIIFSKTRSAFIGIIGAIFVLMYLISKKLFITAVILFIVLNIGVFSISKTFKSRMTAMFNPKIYKTQSKKHGDIESHIALTKSAWIVFKRFPLTGVGVGAFSTYFDEHKGIHFPVYYNPKTGKKEYDTHDNTPENGYLQTLAETGIFSFISLIWLFVLALKLPANLFMSTDDKFKRKIAAITICVSIILFGSFAGGANTSSDDVTNLWLLFLAIFAATNSLPSKEVFTEI